MYTLIILFLVCPVWVLLIEAVHRRGFLPAFRWMINRPFFFLINVVFVYGLVLPAAVFTGRVIIASCAVFLVFFILVVISSFKHFARNEPLYFFDLLLAFKIAGVTGSSNLAVTPVLMVAAAVGAGSLVGVFLLIPAELLFADRFVAVIAFVVAMILSLFEKKKDVTYLTKGFLYGFVHNTGGYFKKPVPPVVESPVLELPVVEPVLQADSTKGVSRTSASHKLPNVIVILSESFFDLTRVPELELSEDPLPFFRALKNRAVTGTLLVTPIGGGTCAVESEFLTGIAERHINSAKPFYYYLSKRQVPSLATYFKGFGYEVHAVHTYNKSFYNRENAFRNMGFDTFTGAEDLRFADKDGFYISDAELTNQIFRLYGAKTAPAFLMGISMENHQPYTPAKYPETDIKILNTKEFSDRTGKRLIQEAETYLHGLRHGDRELKRLVAYVDSQNEPTVLLFFGDHLGTVGRELEFYRRLGYIGRDEGYLSPMDVGRMYSPDFLMVSNFKTERSHFERVGANFLPVVLLDYLEMPKSGLFGVLDEVFPRLRCISRHDIYCDGAGGMLTGLPTELRELELRLQVAEFAAMGMG
ncbi:MAG: LTA synthase family protein [Peptococcaceae bacterium]|nr:LTA synthase family protein [Peptococcaceae bacterium]